MRQIQSIIVTMVACTAQYYENMLEMCGLLDDPACPKAERHHELERADIKKPKEVVTPTITAIESLNALLTKKLPKFWSRLNEMSGEMSSSTLSYKPQQPTIPLFALTKG